MVEDEIIEPSISSHNSPLICVTKKSGEVKQVIDFHRLKSIIFLGSFPLPQIDEILYSFKEAKSFTSLNLRSACYHVTLAAESKELTAFIINFRKYLFKLLSFRLAGSPFVFQAIISHISLHQSLSLMELPLSF